MKHLVIFVVGPTAVGKSSFALRAAQKWKGTIINCDSVQCYQHIQIGAAKPSEDELKMCPHRMLSWIEPFHDLTVAEFRSRAMVEIVESLKTGPVFLVGGSGFYIRALEKGLFKVKEVPPELKKQFQERLQREGVLGLHRELASLDPRAAQQIKPQDSYRVIRALSLMAVEGRTWSAIQDEFEKRTSDWTFPSLKVGLRLPREELLTRIESRTRQMLEAGLVDEVKGGLQRGWKNWAPYRSVGYKEVVAHLQSENSSINSSIASSMDQLKDTIVISTRQLAKKQMTWFQGDESINWFLSHEPWAEVMDFLGSRIEG